MSTRKRHTPEHVVRKLTEADRSLSEGKDVAEVCRTLQVSEATYHRWRNQFGGLKADDAKRLKELEKENATPKRLLGRRGLLSTILAADRLVNSATRVKITDPADRAGPRPVGQYRR